MIEIDKKEVSEVKMRLLLSAGESLICTQCKMLLKTVEEVFLRGTEDGEVMETLCAVCNWKKDQKGA